VLTPSLTLYIFVLLLLLLFSLHRTFSLLQLLPLLLLHIFGEMSNGATPHGLMAKLHLHRHRKVKTNVPAPQKVNPFKKFWRSRVTDEPQHEQLEKKHKKSLQEVLSQPFHEKHLLDVLYGMLNDPDHPYGMVVAQVSRDIINSFEGGEDKEKILADAKSRIDSFAQSMSATAFLQYKNIVSKLTPHEFAALCRDSVFEALLSREPNVILDYYHTKFAHQDITLCNLFEQVSESILPGHLEIPEKFWLISHNGHVSVPYAAAISAFQKFHERKSPMYKVEVLRDTAHKICQCVEQFWNVNRLDFPTGEDPTIAADDLVSIFCYVILKSKVQLLYSESEYIGDYISDNNLVGEIGYLITTLQCCCHVLCDLDPNVIHKDPGVE